MFDGTFNSLIREAIHRQLNIYCRCHVDISGKDREKVCTTTLSLEMPQGRIRDIIAL